LAILPSLSPLGRALLRSCSSLINRLKSCWRHYRLRRCKKRLLAKALQVAPQPLTEINNTCNPCPICREDMTSDILTTMCGHTFHEKCLMKWLWESVTCPECRHNLRSS
jgi:hypothetical protein